MGMRVGNAIEKQQLVEWCQRMDFRVTPKLDIQRAIHSTRRGLRDRRFLAIGFADAWTGPMIHAARTPLRQGNLRLPGIAAKPAGECLESNGTHEHNLSNVENLSSLIYFITSPTCSPHPAPVGPSALPGPRSLSRPTRPATAFECPPTCARESVGHRQTPPPTPRLPPPM